MRIFGLVIVSRAAWEHLENAVNSIDTRLREALTESGKLSTRAVSAEQQLTLTEQHLAIANRERDEFHAQLKAAQLMGAEAATTEASRVKKELRTSLNDLNTLQDEIEKLIEWRNGDGYKKANPKERSDFGGKLSEAYDAFAQRLDSIRQTLN